MFQPSNSIDSNGQKGQEKTDMQLIILQIPFYNLFIDPSSIKSILFATEEGAMNKTGRMPVLKAHRDCITERTSLSTL